jgi:hypothetical protein
MTRMTSVPTRQLYTRLGRFTARSGSVAAGAAGRTGGGTEAPGPPSAEPASNGWPQVAQKRASGGRAAPHLEQNPATVIAWAPQLVVPGGTGLRQ